MPSQMRVYVPDHPLIKHWLTVARDVNTPAVLFKSAMAELGRWLTYEACRYWLDTQETQVQTPLAVTQATVVNPQTPMAIVPILRAGLGLVETAQQILPLASVYHLGLVRDEATLQPSCYLNKLPDRFAPGTRILILDPMLATGGSLVYALKEIVARGGDPGLMRIVSVIAAPPALQQVSAAYQDLQIYTAMIDEGLDDRGFIVPGLGDAGDRCFGTP